MCNFQKFYTFTAVHFWQFLQHFLKYTTKSFYYISFHTPYFIFNSSLLFFLIVDNFCIFTNIVYYYDYTHIILLITFLLQWPLHKPSITINQVHCTAIRLNHNKRTADFYTFIGNSKMQKWKKCTQYTEISKIYKA